MQPIVLFIIPACGLKAWRDAQEASIASIQLGTQTGVLKDGRRFRYVVQDHGDYLSRLAGLRLSEYIIVGGARLTSYELSHLQSMVRP